MKKLLFVISQLYKGGAETALINLLNVLDYKKYEVDLVILNQAPVAHAQSLIGNINKNVKICDAYKEYRKITIIDRVRAKCCYSKEQKGAYLFPALDAVSGKVYDWAFFWGEWYSPSFVAYHVKARKKAAWIHCDIAKADFFNAEQYFYFFDKFDYFVFVSKNSRDTAVEAFPFLKNKARIIYNINDISAIKKNANEKLLDFSNGEVPVFLTCANFREEKNHMRQAIVMAKLKEKGYTFKWVNIGSTAETDRVEKIKKYCRMAGIERDFIILGPKENPYSYMNMADVVTVLSDHESWSMVITEAKILGKPVIATKTSGALEQIEDGKTGVLVDFEIDKMVKKIEEYLQKPQKLKEIEKNICNFDNTEYIMRSFEELLDEQIYSIDKKNILYFIDNINYMGGAHKVTISQIKQLLKQNVNVSVFSVELPRNHLRAELADVHFLSWSDFKENVIYGSSLLNCLFNKEYSDKDKQYKLELFYETHFRKNKDLFTLKVLPHLSEMISEFDVTCVASEASTFRRVVAESRSRKKIQWIHTDYCKWRNLNSWTREITKDDRKIYEKFDAIVLLADNIKNEFINRYPTLKDKIVVTPNIMPVSDIIEKANSGQGGERLHFVTVGRVDNSSKAFGRLLKILIKLKAEGYQYLWTIIGDGENYYEIHDKVQKEGLENDIILRGMLTNPYVEMKQADVFALLSVYEGLPNTIFESLILGTPVLATDVGGIRTQVITGTTGWLVENSEFAIYDMIKNLISNPQQVNDIAKKLQHYHYDNKKIENNNNIIFGIK